MIYADCGRKSLYQIHVRLVHLSQEHTGIGTVLTVLVLLLIAGWNNTAYYPSNIDLQSSLTLANSCSSEFTLRTMAIVSLLIPFVLAYIVFAWRAIDRKRITQEEIEQGEAY